MGLSIIPIGGFGEVGRNCCGVKVDDEIYILDMGLHLDNYVRVSEDEELNHRLSKRLLIKEGAVPDISIINPKQVKAILISHAHLDHVGALPYLANSFSAPIYATPFTIAVAKRLIQDKHKELKNDLIPVKYGKIVQLSKDVKAEFIEVTHSTPHTAAIVLHTKYGNVVYLNDFKLDEKPTLGKKTNLKRLADLKPKAIILDTLYGDVEGHTPGEEFAKELLEKALLSRDLKGRHILATTFSSHIARIQTLVKIAKKMKRKVMIVGRSMSKYLDAAKEVGITNIIDEHECVRFGSKVKKALRRVHNYQEYLFIITGGMGEPKAVLSRIVEQELIPFKNGDLVIFSNKVIPTPTIIESRSKLEHKLLRLGYEVLRDLHVSGHGAQKDHKTILKTIKPQILVPLHGEAHQREGFKQLALEAGYKEKDILLLNNGQETRIE